MISSKEFRFKCHVIQFLQKIRSKFSNMNDKLIKIFPELFEILAHANFQKKKNIFFNKMHTNGLSTNIKT